MENKQGKIKHFNSSFVHRLFRKKDFLIRIVYKRRIKTAKPLGKPIPLSLQQILNGFR
jgi:hypothetical protein